MNFNRNFLLLITTLHTPIMLSAQDQSDILIRTMGNFEIRFEKSKTGEGRLVYVNKNLGLQDVLLDNLMSNDKIIDAMVDSNKCLIIINQLPALVYYIAREQTDGQWKSINGGNIFWTYPSPRAITGSHRVELLDISHLKVTEGELTSVWEFDNTYQKDRAKIQKQK